MLLRNVLDLHDTHYATTVADLPARAGIQHATILPDCNRDDIVRSMGSMFAAILLLLRLRPQIIISTGAAPGFFCMFFGRAIGARTLWIDSVANAEQLSMCGKLSRRFATACLTQWAHLSAPDGPVYRGSLL